MDTSSSESPTQRIRPKVLMESSPAERHTSFAQLPRALSRPGTGQVTCASFQISSPPSAPPSTRLPARNVDLGSVVQLRSSKMCWCSSATQCFGVSLFLQSDSPLPINMGWSWEAFPKLQGFYLLKRTAPFGEEPGRSLLCRKQEGQPGGPPDPAPEQRHPDPSPRSSRLSYAVTGC